MNQAHRDRRAGVTVKVKKLKRATQNGGYFVGNSHQRRVLRRKLMRLVMGKLAAEQNP